MPHRDLITLFNEVVGEFKTVLVTAGRADEFQGLRIIYTAMRDISCDELEWYLIVSSSSKSSLT